MIVYTLPFSKAAIELYLRGRNVPSFSFLNTYAAPSNLEGIAGVINRLPISREGVGQVAEFQLLGKTNATFASNQKNNAATLTAP
jgi:hypothetical protein